MAVMRRWLVLGLAIAMASAGGGIARAAEGDDVFAHFISPISNPTNFEDPRAVSDVRPIYAYHSIAKSFADEVGLGGGGVHVVALQLRLALTDRLALIATKDGYVFVRPENEIPGVVESSNGLANIALGAKYSFFRDPELGIIATGGLRYEIPSGEPQGLQGRVFRSYTGLGLEGDGVLNPFVSALWGNDQLHLVGYVGLRQAISGVDSSFFDMSLHGDFEIADVEVGDTNLGSFYPTMEVNWVQTLDGGRRVPLSDEGFDFFNLGSSNAGGKGTVTMAYGGRWRVTDDLDVFGRKSGVDLGAAIEFPVSTDPGIFGWRVTSDLIFWVL